MEHGEQLPLFDIPPEQAQSKNPMVVSCGPGPEGAICRDCAHLMEYQQANRWYKCGLRKPGGPKTDHRVRWPACAKFRHYIDAAIEED